MPPVHVADVPARYRDAGGRSAATRLPPAPQGAALPDRARGVRRARAPKAEARRQARPGPDRPVVGRVGRDDDLKWRDLLVDMVPDLLELVPDVQILFVGATAAKPSRLERTRACSTAACSPSRPSTRRARRVLRGLRRLRRARPRSGSRRGWRSARRSRSRCPVVTCSTPWADNAQVEFVEHGRSGWLASHPRPFAEAVADLLLDDEQRRGVRRRRPRGRGAAAVAGPADAAARALYPRAARRTARSRTGTRRRSEWSDFARRRTPAGRRRVPAARDRASGPRCWRDAARASARAARVRR